LAATRTEKLSQQKTRGGGADLSDRASGRATLGGLRTKVIWGQGKVNEKNEKKIWESPQRSDRLQHTGGGFKTQKRTNDLVVKTKGKRGRLVERKNPMSKSREKGREERAEKGRVTHQVVARGGDIQKKKKKP